uniref:Integrase catalytic domain-containing protein n=1 Tax=Trichuris muris TaxID=70415 RepID=A0A5S6QF86_TRIMR
MSRDLKEFFTGMGVACSRTTSYNPQGNGQAERYVGVIWKAVTPALKSRGMALGQWRTELNEALHSVRSLLCTATNAIPPERMFNFIRRSATGMSLPSWLQRPGPVLLRKNERSSKMDPLVEEVELLEATPLYAHVRYPDRRESSVSLRHLAPAGSHEVEEIEALNVAPGEDSAHEPGKEPIGSGSPSPNFTTSSQPTERIDPLNHEAVQMSEGEPPGGASTLRRSARTRRPPERLDL